MVIVFYKTNNTFLKWFYRVTQQPRGNRWEFFGYHLKNRYIVVEEIIKMQESEINYNRVGTAIKTGWYTHQYHPDTHLYHPPWWGGFLNGLFVMVRKSRCCKMLL
jgi:hypothetical protein